MAKHLDLSAIPPSVSTTIDPDFGIVQDLSDSGVLHRRGLFGATYYQVTLQWDLLTVAQRQTLEWFFAEEAKLEPITFTLDGHDYTAELVAGPTRRYVTGTLYGIAVTLRGTRVDSTGPAPDPIAEIIAQYTQASSWYDPADPATVWQDVAGTVPALVGSPVARIDDKGNLGLHATQPNPANRPTLQQDGQRVYLQFAASQTLSIPTGMPVPTTGLSAFVSWRHEGYPGTYPDLYFQRGSDYDANHRQPLMHLISTNSLAQQIGNQSINTLAGSTPINNDYLATNHLAVDNLARKAYLNGVLYGTTTALTLGDAGDNQTGQIARNYLGRIYEIVHIQHGITDEHRRAIESAMAAKSGAGL